MTRKDVIGLSLSIAAASGALLLTPLQKTGWGDVCGWSTIFPIYGLIFPAPVFDGCDGWGYGAFVALYLSLALLVAGAIASRVAQRPSRRRGAVVNASFTAAALFVLLWRAEPGFDVSRSLAVATIAIMTAACIGFAVGPRRTSRPQ